LPPLIPPKGDKMKLGKTIGVVVAIVGMIIAALAVFTVGPRM
jgi:hypothetical protein